MTIWFAAALFAGQILTTSLFALALSGHFPHQFRADGLQGVAGSAIMAATTIVSVTAIATALFASWRSVPWYMMVIGGGAAILFAPLVLAACPDRFVNGRGALLAFSGASLLLAIALLAIL